MEDNEERERLSDVSLHDQPRNRRYAFPQCRHKQPHSLKPEHDCVFWQEEQEMCDVQGSGREHEMTRSANQYESR